MNMSTWQHKHQTLRDFIAARPEIKLEPTGVSIPREVRDEFYVRFDAVRRAFVDHCYSSLPPDIDALSERYVRLEKEICDALKIEAISMPVDLQTFLRNPREGLMRALYSPLFDLLQGKIDGEAFEAKAEQEIKTAAAELLRLGYERWVALSIVKLLDPDEAFAVALNEEDKAVAEELNTIAFGRQAHHVTLRVPEFVLHSRALGKYVAVKLQLTAEIATYSPSQPSPPKRYRTGDTSAALDSRVMLLSVIPGLNDIPVTANLANQKVSPPDVAIECFEQADLEDATALERVRKRHEILRPKAGTYLVSRNATEAGASGAAGEDVQPVAVGFDPSRLNPLLERL
jgi:hypothetical protein